MARLPAFGSARRSSSSLQLVPPLMQGLTHALLYGIAEIDTSDDVLDAHEILARASPTSISPQLIQISRALVEHARGKTETALEVCHTIRTQLPTDAPANMAGAAWAAESAILRDLGRYHDAAQLLTQAALQVGEDNVFMTDALATRSRPSTPTGGLMGSVGRDGTCTSG